MKFQLGLFESSNADPERAARLMDSDEHRALARRVARESIVLLKNSGNILPLSRGIDSIAVIGPNADNVYNQLGYYTAPQPDGKVVTVLQGIRAAVGPNTIIHYAKGASIRGSSEAGFAEAMEAVRKSSIAIVVLGGSSAANFDNAFQETGAAEPDRSGDSEAGEGLDRATLNLAGVQQKLLEQTVAVGKPVVLVLIEGRPLELARESESVQAILYAWYPGEAGGLAIADVLFGNYNPAGRLAISVPRSVGQLPVYYGQGRTNYVDMPASPQFAFGYGLSYTTFKYANLRATAKPTSDSVSVEVSVDITNTGKRAGEEVAQLYLHPLVSSVVTPDKALRGFDRVHLEAGETQTVKFHLRPEELAVFNQQNKWVVEPGTFEVMVGGSSDEIQNTVQFVVAQSVALP